MSWMRDQWEEEDEAAEEWRLQARTKVVQLAKEGLRIKELRAARDACRTGGKEAQDRLMNKVDNVWELLQNIMLHYRWSANASITPAEAEDERSALRKLALAALQFLANLTAENSRTAAWVFEKSYKGRFLEYLEAFSRDRDLVMCTCVIVHNHLALAEEKDLAVEKLLEDGALICKLMRILLPQSTSSSSSSSSSSNVEEADPVFEWVYLILLKILETGQGKEAFEKSGLDEDTLHDMMADYEPQSNDDAKKSECLFESVKQQQQQQGLYEPPPVFTAEQLLFMNLLEHVLTDTYVHGSSSSSSSSSSGSSADAKEREEGKEVGGVESSSLLVIKDGGAMLLEMVDRVKTCLKYRPLYTPKQQQQQQQQQHPHYAEVMMIEEAIATVVRLLAGALAMEGEGEEGRKGGRLDREALVENGLVGVILTLLKQEGGQADGSIPPMDATGATGAAATATAAATAREGRKAQLIRVLGNLCHRCRSAQDEVRREEGGLALVLNHCNVDSSNPFLREWALFCVRNLCEGNEENQRVVGELQVQGAVQTSMLREVGLEARVVEGGGEGGRAKVTLVKTMM